MITREKKCARKALAVAGATLLTLVLGADAARAEVLLTPFAGVDFSGSSRGEPLTYGGALGFLGAGIAGFEIEFATTPDFFGNAADGDVFNENNVISLMGNFLLAVPGPVRLYGAVGFGLMKTRLEDPDRLFSIDSNDFGFNVGGGVIFFLGDHIGLRGDIRYFRDFSDNQPDGDFDIDLGQVDYWRAVGGITFKF